MKSTASAGASLEYIVFESSPRFGGVLVTERVDGCLVEAGPDSFLTEKPWASDLCRELGLGDQLIGSNDADRKTYILVKGKLVAIPDGLMFMVPTKITPTALSPLFSSRTKLRMAREWFHPPRKADADETVAALVERHYGAEMVDRLADPLALRRVWRRGQSTQRARRAAALCRNGSNVWQPGPRHAGSSQENGACCEDPAQTAVHFSERRYAAVGGGESLLGSPHPRFIQYSPVQCIQRQDSGWVVSAGYASDQFDAVIMATPAQAAADLSGMVSVELATELRGIQYTSSVTVNLGYDRSVRASLPPGFGFLVPRSEGKRMLAATFVHNKFPHRAPDDRALLRCFLGGARNEQVLQSPMTKLSAWFARSFGKSSG